MEKELSCQLKERLKDLDAGQCLLRIYSYPAKTVQEKLFPLGDFKDTKLLLEHYDLYPGMGITFAWCLGHKFAFHHSHKPSVLKIDHCNLGRIGWNMENGQSLYVGKGDLAVHCRDACKESRTEITFPLGY